MQVIYPSLSSTGWITSSESMIDLIFGHYLTSSYSQDYIFRGSVRSLPYTIEQYNGKNNNSGLEQAIRVDLEDLYGDLFTINSVDVTVAKIPSSNGLKINIYMALTDNEGKTLNLSQVLSSINGVVNKLANINNTGTL